MANFREMYFRLFNRVTDVIETLQQAQQEGEHVYLESNDPDDESDDEQSDD